MFLSYQKPWVSFSPPSAREGVSQRKIRAQKENKNKSISSQKPLSVSLTNAGIKINTISFQAKTERPQKQNKALTRNWTVKLVPCKLVSGWLFLLFGSVGGWGLGFGWFTSLDSFKFFLFFLFLRWILSEEEKKYVHILASQNVKTQPSHPAYCVNPHSYIRIALQLDQSRLDR